MPKFNVPTKEQVSANNQEIFEGLEKKVGFVPNVYATTAYSDNALEAYLNFSESQGKGSLSAKEREVINLVVSQVNGCRYCQSAHTELAKMNGFSEDEALEFRQGKSGDSKLDALVKLAQEIAEGRGNVSNEILENFFNEGYDKGSLMDVALAVTTVTFTNYVNNITHIPIDFPLAKSLSQGAVTTA